MEFVGPVDTRGQLDEDTRAEIRDGLKRFAGKRVRVVVTEDQDRRSTRANRYYWGVVIKLFAEHTGYDAHDLHEALAMKFLRIEDCPITGAPRRKRTPKTDTQEFREYVDACIRLAAEYGVVIPDAREAA